LSIHVNCEAAVSWGEIAPWWLVLYGDDTVQHQDRVPLMSEKEKDLIGLSWFLRCITGEDTYALKCWVAVPLPHFLVGVGDNVSTWSDPLTTLLTRRN